MTEKDREQEREVEKKNEQSEGHGNMYNALSGIKEGKVISEIEIFLTNQGKVKDFIARGTVKDLKAETFSDLNLKKLNLNFFADKYDILIKNIYGNLEDISILNGDVKLNLENGIKLKANFNSKLDLNEKFLNKYHKL